jgi:hypothetical protein
MDSRGWLVAGGIGTLAAGAGSRAAFMFCNVGRVLSRVPFSTTVVLSFVLDKTGAQARDFLSATRSAYGNRLRALTALSRPMGSSRTHLRRGCDERFGQDAENTFRWGAEGVCVRVLLGDVEEGLGTVADAAKPFKRWVPISLRRLDEFVSVHVARRDIAAGLQRAQRGSSLVNIFSIRWMTGANEGEQTAKRPHVRSLRWLQVWCRCGCSRHASQRGSDTLDRRPATLVPNVLAGAFFGGGHIF